MLDKLKLKAVTELVRTIMPDFEIKIVERAKFDGKEWMAVLIRETKDERCTDQH